ncbi:unnamed protein product [Rotaria sp. Silwood2]|nr:unnamed protein product [Rotaria sp. Silwood2]CAF3461052.1 unnamed protein product [Rotaria sp. Silwood2]CAF4244177.1 unnamed protein product [Rotaria sp. Silwood2]
MPIDDSIPANDTCQFISRNNTQCSVFVEIDHIERVATGRFGVETCNNIPVRRLETIIKLDYSLLSIIRYTCKENYCDVNFLDHLLDRARLIPTMSRIIIEENTTEIYNAQPGTTSIDCSSNSNSFCRDLCQGKFAVEDISGDISINLNGNITCHDRSRDDYLFNITQNYSSSDTVPTEMIFRCNRDSCINSTIVEQIYNFLKPNFINETFDSFLPDSDEPCMPIISTATSFLFVSHGFIKLATIFLLFY